MEQFEEKKLNEFLHALKETFKDFVTDAYEEGFHDGADEAQAKLDDDEDDREEQNRPELTYEYDPMDVYRGVRKVDVVDLNALIKRFHYLTVGGTFQREAGADPYLSGFMDAMRTLGVLR